MAARSFIHFLLVLSLALGPSVSALAEGLAGRDAGATQHMAGHQHADLDKGQDTGHNHAQGHNHSICGAQCCAACFTGLPTLLSVVSTVSPPLQYFSLSVPVTGIVVSTALRPPQTLPG